MSSETVPYLVRALSATVAVSDGIQAAMDANSSDSDAQDIIRDTSLTVATLDRVLSDFVVHLLEKMRIRVSMDTPLSELLELLKSSVTSTQHKHLPPGGIVSLLYHMVSALEDTNESLKRLSRSRWDRTSTYAYPIVAGGLFLLVKYTKLGKIPATIWNFRALSGRQVQNWFIFFVGMAFAKLFRAVNARISAKVRLRRLHGQLLILLRMWLIAADSFQKANIDRSKSYNVMLAALSDQDFNAAAQPVARQLLSYTSLPRSAAIWPTKALSLSLLKRVLDVIYSAFEPGYYVAQGAGWLGTALSVPVTIASFAYYGLQPAVAGERAAAIMFDPDVNYIKFIWRLSDSRVARAVAKRLVPALAQFEDADIDGTPCHILSNARCDLQCEPSHALTNRKPRLVQYTSSSASTLERIQEAVSEDSHESPMHSAQMAGGAKSRISAQQLQGAVEADAFDAATATPQVRHHHSVSSDCLSSPAGAHLPGLSLPAPQVEAPLPPALIYIHGGGFVGSFFATDSIMLGKWVAATDSNVCVIYPHYTLSPEARYPVALDEILRVYLWARARCPRVALAGESAGGNLAAGLVVRLIAEGLPLPDGLIMCYPALCLNPSPSASRALHLNDPLVPVNLLLKLAEAYKPPGPMDSFIQRPSAGTTAGLEQSFSGFTTATDPRSPSFDGKVSSPGLAHDNSASTQQMFSNVVTNPCIHPLYAPDDMLRRFPTTHIMAGGLDPLLDDAVDFNTRLRRVGVPGDLQVHRSLPHGYLYFPFVPNAVEAIEMTRKYCMDVLTA